jgi:hypothetical protein
MPDVLPVPRHIPYKDYQHKVRKRHGDTGAVGEKEASMQTRWRSAAKMVRTYGTTTSKQDNRDTKVDSRRLASSAQMRLQAIEGDSGSATRQQAGTQARWRGANLNVASANETVRSWHQRGSRLGPGDQWGHTHNPVRTHKMDEVRCRNRINAIEVNVAHRIQSCQKFFVLDQHLHPSEQRRPIMPDLRKLTVRIPARKPAQEDVIKPVEGRPLHSGHNVMREQETHIPSEPSVPPASASINRE